MNSALDNLRNRIMGEIWEPLTLTGTRALDSFLELPNIERWNPLNMHLCELSRVFDIGLPFSLLLSNTTVDEHRLQIGGAISRGDDLSLSLLSEVHAGALLSNWGAQVRYVPRQDTRTPDIEATWDMASTIDVEVVRGGTRQLHISVQNGLNSFVGALQPYDITWSVMAFMADASNNEDINNMFEAAILLRPQQSAEEEGRWNVRAIPQGE